MSLQPRSVNFDESWARIVTIIDAVLYANAIDKAAWNQVFFDIYHLCNTNECQDNGERVYKAFEEHIKDHVSELAKKLRSIDNPENRLLHEYHLEWSQYKAAAFYLNNMFTNLNMVYCRRNRMTSSYGEDLLASDYAAGEPGTAPEIQHVSMNTWSAQLMVRLSEQLVICVLQEVNKDRLGLSTQQQLLKSVIDSFIDVEAHNTAPNRLHLYTQVLESRYLIATDDFYQVQVQKMLEQYDCAGYLQVARRRFQDESQRSRRFLHPNSFAKVSEKFYRRTVDSQLTWLNEEAKKMIEQESREDLRNFYELVKPVNGAIDKAVDMFAEHVEVRTVASIKDVTKVRAAPSGSESAADTSPTVFGTVDSCQYIENLMKVQKHYADFIGDVFDQDTAFLAAMDRVFSKVINSKSPIFSTSKPSSSAALKQPCAPMFLVQYCDTLLRKTTKGLSESEIDEKLSNSIIIFKYIEDKDLFSKWYSQLLSKRLINQNSVSMNLEEDMIKRLKDTCGFDYARKLQKMIQDVQICQTLNPDFGQWLTDHNKRLEHSYYILVLTAGNWPIALAANTATSNAGSSDGQQPTASGSAVVAGHSVAPSQDVSNRALPTDRFRLPLELEQCVSMFQEFYDGKFNGRRLTWHHQLATCEISFHPANLGSVGGSDGTTGSAAAVPRRFLINTTTYVAAILLVFNDAGRQSMKNIQAEVGIASGELRRLIEFLCNAKLLVASQSSDSTTYYSVNDDYKNKRTKFRLMPASSNAKELASQTDKTTTMVQQDRKLELEAAVVRIMKARKRLAHSTLIQEVINQVKRRFVPNISLIKTVIETLIEKEYLTRDPRDPQIYVYIS